MAQLILVLGNSGTGKSTAMRNLNPNEVALVNVSKKPLPFRGQFPESIQTDDYKKICDFLSKTNKKIIIIDDFQYVLSMEWLRTIDEKGYDKYNRLAYHYVKIIDTAMNLTDDKIVIFTSHTDKNDSGQEGIKTIGKILNEKINVEGLFTIVLKTLVQDGNYYFTTKNNGMDTVKTPMGMFSADVIDNDLAYVVDKVREYYNMGDSKPPEELARLDEEKKATIELPKKRTRPKLDSNCPF